MRTVVGVALAGAAGALARYGLDTVISRRFGAAFPWGTFVVNVSGAFLAGVVLVVLAEHTEIASWVRPTVGVGFLGAYTTFSTLSLQTYRFLESGAAASAVAYSLGSLVVGVGAVFAGVLVGRAI